MLRNALRVTDLHRLNRNIPGVSEISRILNYNHERSSSINYMNIRNVHNYKKNNDQKCDEVSKTILFHKYLRLIKNSIRESGPILEQNPKLACAIENARKINLPSEFINFAIKITCDIRCTSGYFDLLLPHGCHVLVQYEDVDPAVTRHHLLELCDKFDGTFIQGDTVWPRSFEQKGIISIKCQEPDTFLNLSKEKVYQLGVQSFHKEADIEGVKYWKFYCDPWHLPEVKQELFQISKSIEEVYVGYLPKKLNIPSYYVKNNIFNIFTKLCEVPSIDNVYTNVNVIN